MAEEFIGSLVVVDCGASLGSYQGRILNVDAESQTLTLEHPLRNGVPFQVPKLTLKSADIIDLKILKGADEFEKSVNDVLSSCRSGGGGGSKVVQTESINKITSIWLVDNNGAYDNGHDPFVSRSEKSPDVRGKTKVASKFQQQQHHIHVSPGDLFRSGSERKKPVKLSPSYLERPRSHPKEEHQPFANSHVQTPDKTRIGPLSDLFSPLDHDLMATDFDFEGNLAQFEKLPKQPQPQPPPPPQRHAVKTPRAITATKLLESSKDSQHKSITTTTTPSFAGKSIRHDEHVVRDPTRIYVNAKRSWRYLTEDGVEVQSLSALQKRQLYDRALAKGWITQDGFTCSVAESAARLCFQLLKEQNIVSDSVHFYMIFSSADTVPTQTAKYLTRYFMNRGHSATWIVTNGIAHYGHGVEILSDSHSLATTAPRLASFVFVIGRQGILADDVSAWLLRNKFNAIMFVETDWRGVDSLIPDEDMLMRLGLDEGGLIKLPSRLLLCWQLPCEEADSALTSPVYICDTNIPSHFFENELPPMVASKDTARQKSRPYKFPFGEGSIVKLRKL